MKVARLKIGNFRGIKSALLHFPDHVVLVADNNVGKSTALEALDLALGPDRLNRHPRIDEHDFHLGDYVSAEEGPRKEVVIETVVIDLNSEQQNRFVALVEWWNTTKQDFQKKPVAGVDDPAVVAAIRVTFVGYYDPEIDDFSGDTFFSRTMEEGGVPVPFRKADKQFCGFLYLRSVRTGSRALSLEHGSLLDIILRIKELKPLMWETTLEQVSAFNVANDPKLGLTGVLESIEDAIKKYVPKEWGVTPHLKVSSLTRESLRKVITAFIATGDGKHAAPFYRQGHGTVNMLVLAMLTQIAEGKQNVIFAMEEPETAIPPYAQKRIVHELRKLSSQTIFTSHSPYVLEEFDVSELCILARGNDGVLKQSRIELPASIKPKKYRQDFRTRFCEALLSRRVLIAEGATETACMPAVARRLEELDPTTYASFEALGICTMDAATETQIAETGKLYRDLGKTVYAVCDLQSAASKAAIEANIDKLFMHSESDIEKLVINNTTQAALERFLDAVAWPPHLKTKYPTPKTQAKEAVLDYCNWAKGQGGLAEFLTQCTEAEVPLWIRETCKELRALCQPPATQPLAAAATADDETPPTDPPKPDGSGASGA